MECEFATNTGRGSYYCIRPLSNARAVRMDLWTSFLLAIFSPYPNCTAAEVESQIQFYIPRGEWRNTLLINIQKALKQTLLWDFVALSLWAILQRATRYHQVLYWTQTHLCDVGGLYSRRTPFIAPWNWFGPISRYRPSWKSGLCFDRARISLHQCGGSMETADKGAGHEVTSWWLLSHGKHACTWRAHRFGENGTVRP